MKRKNETVLITGATSGIGLALAEKFANNGYHLVFVARNKDKLHELASEFEPRFNVKITTIIQDLLEKEAAYSVYAQLKQKNIDVDILINNAGYNEAGHFIKTDLEKEIGLVQLHISVEIELVKLLLPGMVARGYGHVVNLGSTASFLPVPGNAVYAATKMFTYSFSNAIRHELRNTGVKVTTLCPGATLTNFQIEAGLSDLRLFNMFTMSPRKVAGIAYSGILRGKRKIIPGFYNKMLVLSSWLSPLWMTNPITDWMYKPVK